MSLYCFSISTSSPLKHHNPILIIVYFNPLAPTPSTGSWKYYEVWIFTKISELKRQNGIKQKLWSCKHKTVRFFTIMQFLCLHLVWSSKLFEQELKSILFSAVDQSGVSSPMVRVMANGHPVVSSTHNYCVPTNSNLTLQCEAKIEQGRDVEMQWIINENKTLTGFSTRYL